MVTLFGAGSGCSFHREVWFASDSLAKAYQGATNGCPEPWLVNRSRSGDVSAPVFGVEGLT